MNIEQVREYTLSLYGVTEDQPFGDDIITFRLEGKIFVCLWLPSVFPSSILDAFQLEGLIFWCHIFFLFSYSQWGHQERILD